MHVIGSQSESAVARSVLFERVPWRDHVARAALVASVASLAALALGRAGAQSIGQGGAKASPVLT
jgi:hypothetical protein